MFIIAIMLIIATGIYIGYRLRSKNTGSVVRVITGYIWLLLFLLGMEVGGNDKLIKGLFTFGQEAFLLMIAGVAGSVLASWALWTFLSKRHDIKKEEK